MAVDLRPVERPERGQRRLGLEQMGLVGGRVVVPREEQLVVLDDARGAEDAEHLASAPP